MQLMPTSVHHCIASRLTVPHLSPFTPCPSPSPSHPSPFAPQFSYTKTTGKDEVYLMTVVPSDMHQEAGQQLLTRHFRTLSRCLLQVRWYRVLGRGKGWGAKAALGRGGGRGDSSRYESKA